MTNQSYNNIPKLRFLEFTEDWKEYSFADIFNRITRKNIENNENVLTISGQKGLVNQKKYFNKSVSSKDVTGYYLLKKNEFAYNKSYSKGYPMGAIKRLLRYEKGVLSTLYICFGLKNPNEDPGYYEQYFEGGYINKEINKIAQEGARNHGLLNISVTDFFKDISLYSPGYEEQQKIASFLSNVDKWITNLKHQKKALEQYKKGMMQKIFSQEIRFKDESGKDFPEWEKKKLGEIFTEMSGRMTDADYRMLSVTINKGVVLQANTIKEGTASKDKSNYKVVYVDDIAYNTMRMWQGASGVSQYEGIVSPAYTVVRPNQGVSEFYGYLFKHPRTVFDFYRYSQGLTSDTWNLKYKHFSEVLVYIPMNEKEQVRIADFLRNIEEMIEAKEQRISHAEQWKKGLLQRMFV